ncbi:MAG: hypothetical protein LBS81_03810 [Endomicrobium sp.]|jgi:superfamily I DNA and/or RNA helicase|nr:hypothetical protein [Endomicrobium sp.]
MLTDYITMDDYSKHNIKVGDAATFQGDERDIILLSMVVSPSDIKNQWL